MSQRTRYVTLLKDQFCFFMHNLPKFQNMHPYRITPATDIAAHVGTIHPALPGPFAVPETYFFSKELVAYLETLIAFSCFYRADARNQLSWPMEPLVPTDRPHPRPKTKVAKAAKRLVFATETFFVMVK
jgi:hypothetical protein